MKYQKRKNVEKQTLFAENNSLPHKIQSYSLYQCWQVIV